MCEPCGWMVTSCRVTQMEVNCIYKTCLVHYLLFLVLFTQFIFHTFKNLNTLVKTHKLLSEYSLWNENWHLIIHCCLYLCEPACLRLSLRWNISAVISYLSLVKTEFGLTDINFIIIMPSVQHEIQTDRCWNGHFSWAMYEQCLRSHIIGNICMFRFIQDTRQNSDHFVLFPQSTKQCQHWICVAADIWTFTPHVCFLLHWEYGAKKVATVLQYHLVCVFVTKRGCLYHMQQVTYTFKQNACLRGRLLGSRRDHVFAGQFTPFRRVVTVTTSTLLQHFEQKTCSSK